MINFGPKAKKATAAKAKKAKRKPSNKVPRRPVGYFALSTEDIAEMNMFSAAAAEMNFRADQRGKAEAKVRAKAKA